jgi:dextranase
VSAESAARAALRIDDAYPARALSRPGGTVELRIELDNSGDAVEATLTGELRENGRVVARAAVPIGLVAGRQAHSLELALPPESPRGYEAVLRVEAVGDDEPSGAGPAEGVGPSAETVVARTAVLVVRHWREAPRYGFLSEFAPGEPSLDRVAQLARYHLTVVQFYDWMYRHWRFLPPGDQAPGAGLEEEFEDAMGRRLSLATVRRRIEACREAGMAALAYGAVYGAEPEFVRDRPDWVLRDAHGEQLSLIDLFFITDLRPGAPWREHILREFEAAMNGAGFDGIHMDQYGFPKWSYDANGSAVDLGACFGGLIDEAARRVSTLREGAAVLFNAVNNWPIERIAGSDQAAVYIEVWPPHDSYRDLVDLVRRARDLAGRQAILAAYLEPFREGGAGAEEAALLATAVIASAGGFHLLLGEGDAVLRDPYYPNHGRMTPEFARRMRLYYDHTAALHHYLYDPSLEVADDTLAGGINTEITLEGWAASSVPRAGAVWLTVRRRGPQLVVNLVNITGGNDDRWNAPKEAPPALEGLALGLSRLFRIRRATWSSPDEGAGTYELDAAPHGSSGAGRGGTLLVLPPLRTWATLVLDLE